MDMPAFDCNELDVDRVAPYNIRFKEKVLVEKKSYRMKRREEETIFPPMFVY